MIGLCFLNSRIAPIAPTNPKTTQITVRAMIMITVPGKRSARIVAPVNEITVPIVQHCVLHTSIPPVDIVCVIEIGPASDSLPVAY
jgi:hypothetical protein